MKTYYAKTIKDLAKVLQEIAAAYPDATWHGYDDESIIVSGTGDRVFIEPGDPPPPPVKVEYRCAYCGARRKSTSGPMSCPVCSWKPMMRPVQGSGGDVDMSDRKTMTTRSRERLRQLRSLPNPLRSAVGKVVEAMNEADEAHRGGEVTDAQMDTFLDLVAEVFSRRRRLTG